MLCDSQFWRYLKNVPILQIGYFLTNFSRHGERNDVLVKLFSMVMSAFLHSYESTDFSQMNPALIVPFICHFPEVLCGLQEFLLYMLKHKMDASCVLEWWEKIFITMKNLVFGSALRRFILESFLSDLKMLRRVDFDLDTVKKALDSCFPGSFRKMDNITRFFLQMLLAQENTIQLNYEGYYPGSYVDKNIFEIYLFSRLKKAEIGLMLVALFESSDVMSTKEGLVNFDVKKFAMKFTAPEIWKQCENAAIKWSIQDMVDSVTIDEKSLNLIWHIQNTLDREGIQSKKRAFMTIVDLAIDCNNERNGDNGLDDKYKEIRKELEKLEQELSSNWMGRNSLHLLALICYKEEVFSSLEAACPDLIKSLMGHRDVHGTTPYLLACACKNDIARKFLLRNGATPSERDFFGNTDEQLLQQTYLFWVEKEMTKPFIPLSQLDYSLHDREVIIQYVKQLFEMMIKEIVKSHPMLEATMEIVGSVREQTKVAQMDEFDIQILFQKLSKRVRKYDFSARESHITFDHAHDYSGLMSEQGRLDLIALIDIIKKSMQATLTKIDPSCILLRVIDLDDPWLMIYEGNGKSKGMLISFDIVPVIEIPDDMLEDDIPEQVMSRQSQILKDPIRNPLRVFLKRSKLVEESFRSTCARSERDIIDCLPVEARLGVVMIKSLLRQQRDCAISSYMVKTALFHSLDEKIKNGEITKLEKPENSEQWITNSTAKEYYNEGRKWAVDILTHITTAKCAFLDYGETSGIEDAAACVDGIIKLVDD